ncbi:hypothetical protein [Naumannella huperziae]
MNASSISGLPGPAAIMVAMLLLAGCTSPPTPDPPPGPPPLELPPLPDREAQPLDEWVTAIESDGDQVVALGEVGVTATTYRLSVDGGATFTEATVAPELTRVGGPSNLLRTPDGWWALGERDGAPVVLTSPDGTSWSGTAPEGIDRTAEIREVALVGDRFVAVGSQLVDDEWHRRAWLSDDGIAWRTVIEDKRGELSAIAVAPAGTAVLVGYDDTGERWREIALASTDGGKSWRPRKLPDTGAEQGGAQRLYDVAWDGRGFLAIGGGWFASGRSATYRAYLRSADEGGEGWHRRADARLPEQTMDQGWLLDSGGAAIVVVTTVDRKRRSERLFRSGAGTPELRLDAAGVKGELDSPRLARAGNRWLLTGWSQDRPVLLRSRDGVSFERGDLAHARAAAPRPTVTAVRAGPGGLAILGYSQGAIALWSRGPDGRTGVPIMISDDPDDWIAGFAMDADGTAVIGGGADQDGGGDLPRAWVVRGGRVERIPIADPEPSGDVPATGEIGVPMVNEGTWYLPGVADLSEDDHRTMIMSSTDLATWREARPLRVREKGRRDQPEVTDLRSPNRRSAPRLAAHGDALIAVAGMATDPGLAMASWVSTDGERYAQHSYGLRSASSVSLYTLASDGSTLLAGGGLDQDGKPGRAVFWTGSDGKSWKQVELPGESDRVERVARIGERWYAASAMADGSYRLWSATDPATWQELAVPGDPAAEREIRDIVDAGGPHVVLESRYPDGRARTDLLPLG